MPSVKIILLLGTSSFVLASCSGGEEPTRQRAEDVPIQVAEPAAEPADIEPYDQTMMPALTGDVVDVVDNTAAE